jgi:hypothetical protein
MTTSTERSLEGGCACGHVRYSVLGEPIIVHCCHCTWCQRETGSAFAINALFSSARVTLLSAADPITILTPSESGRGQDIVRCPKCFVALWSNYGRAGKVVKFVRVGSLDEPQRFTPDVHIFACSKVPWVALPHDVPAFNEFYDVGKLWAKEVDERRHAVMLEIQAARAAQADDSKQM